MKQDAAELLGSQQIFDCEQTGFTGILTGHFEVRKHLHTRGCKQEDKTIVHILYDCSTLLFIKIFMFGEFWLTPADIRDVPLGYVINYIKSVG